MFDSGAIKTVIPPDAIPNMVIHKSKTPGRVFRMANGSEIPNLGRAKIQGKNPLNANPMRFSTSVADITKPLASVNEMVDSDNLIVLHDKGGAIKHLSSEDKKKVLDLIESMKGNVVPMVREAGTFKIAIDVPDSAPTGESNWSVPKKTVKAKQSNAMDVDFSEDTQWSKAEEIKFECGDCEQELAFHRLFGR